MGNGHELDQPRANIQRNGRLLSAEEAHSCPAYFEVETVGYAITRAWFCQASKAL
jgi:hypothetical protein